MTSARTVTLRGLVPGRFYCVRVVAVNQAGEGYDNWIRFRPGVHAPPPAPNGPPCNFRVLLYDLFQEAVRLTMLVSAS